MPAGNPPKIMSGARAIVTMIDPAGQTTKTLGIYNNLSYHVVYDVQAAFILGRYGPAALDYTAVEAVNITAQGYRVINHGPHADAMVPLIQDLMTVGDLTFLITDRANPTIILAKITGVRSTGYSTALTAKQLEELTLPYMGLLVSDENLTENGEGSDAAQLP